MRTPTAPPHGGPARSSQKKSSRFRIRLSSSFAASIHSLLPIVPPSLPLHTNTLPSFFLHLHSFSWCLCHSGSPLATPRSFFCFFSIILPKFRSFLFPFNLRSETPPAGSFSTRQTKPPISSWMKIPSAMVSPRTGPVSIPFSTALI